MIFLESFFDVLLLVIWIIDFIALNNIFRGFTGSSLIAIILAGVVTYVIIIPYDWFAILVFFATFAYSFFWGFQPWTWGTDGEGDADKKAKEVKKSGGGGHASHEAHGGGHDSHASHDAHDSHGGGHDDHASHDSHDTHASHDSHDDHKGGHH